MIEEHVHNNRKSQAATLICPLCFGLRCLVDILCIKLNGGEQKLYLQLSLCWRSRRCVRRCWKMFKSVSCTAHTSTSGQRSSTTTPPRVISPIQRNCRWWRWVQLKLRFPFVGETKRGENEKRMLVSPGHFVGVIVIQKRSSLLPSEHSGQHQRAEGETASFTQLVHGFCHESGSGQHQLCSWQRRLRWKCRWKQKHKRQSVNRHSWTTDFCYSSSRWVQHEMKLLVLLTVVFKTFQFDPFLSVWSQRVLPHA